MITAVCCVTTASKKLLSIFSFNALFSVDCWNFLATAWDANLQPHGMFLQARTNFGDSIFRELVMVGRTYSRRRRARDVRRDAERAERAGGAHEDALGAITVSG